MFSCLCMDTYATEERVIEMWVSLWREERWGLGISVLVNEILLYVSRWRSIDDTEAPVALLWRGLWEGWGLEAWGCGDPGPAWSRKFPLSLWQDESSLSGPNNWHERRKQLTGHSPQTDFETVPLEQIETFFLSFHGHRILQILIYVPAKCKLSINQRTVPRFGLPFWNTLNVFWVGRLFPFYSL